MCVNVSVQRRRQLGKQVAAGEWKNTRNSVTEIGKSWLSSNKLKSLSRDQLILHDQRKEGEKKIKAMLFLKNFYG
jgi:ribosome recycling factor